VCVCGGGGVETGVGGGGGGGGGGAGPPGVRGEFTVALSTPLKGVMGLCTCTVLWQNKVLVVTIKVLRLALLSM
jgi:hypothetical protein